MQAYQIPSIHHKKIILALGAESAGNFSLWRAGELFHSEDFGDLIDPQNFSTFKTALLKFLKTQKIKPELILSDLHPLFETTKFAQQLAKKYKAQYLPFQHHHAHLFSTIGDQIIQEPKKLKSYSLKSCLGIACDGTGLGTDGKIWGGEVFKMSNVKYQISNKIQDSKIKIQRIGHLENQVLLGGEMAIQEPARFIITIINKCQMSNVKFPIKSQFSNIKNKKQLAYEIVKKYYTHNEFEVLWKQLEQNFNCVETSSTARVLDAVSVLLGFSKNERFSKHQPVKLLEENSTKPYLNLNPKIKILNPNKVQNQNDQNSTVKYILETTPLFEYLIKNLHRDKKRLAATAQKYIADGLMEIVKTCHPELVSGSKAREIPDQVRNDKLGFASGGMMNNKIISEILTKQGFYLNQKIPCGDAGLSFGQIMFYLLTK
jgi:hydrogenase maturation protein HypF